MRNDVDRRRESSTSARFHYIPRFFLINEFDYSDSWIWARISSHIFFYRFFISSCKLYECLARNLVVTLLLKMSKNLQSVKLFVVFQLTTWSRQLKIMIHCKLQHSAYRWRRRTTRMSRRKSTNCSLSRNFRVDYRDYYELRCYVLTDRPFINRQIRIFNFVGQRSK